MSWCTDIKPYSDDLEHLLDELSRIDRMLHIYLEKIQANFPEPVDEFRGLYISEAEIRAIQKNPGFGAGNNMLSCLEEIETIRQGINTRKNKSLKNGRKLRLHTISELFGLGPFETDVLLIGLAPELDLKYEKLYSYLQNDVTKKYPSVDLILNLLSPGVEEKLKARTCFSPAAPLLRKRLISLAGNDVNGYPESQKSLISSCIKTDERIVNFLLGFDELDSAIRSFSYLIKPEEAFETLVLPEELKNSLEDSVNWHIWNQTPLKFLFCGPCGSGKKTAAKAACRKAGLPLLVVDSGALLNGGFSSGNFSEILALVLREVLLQESALYLENFDLLFREIEKPFRAPLLLDLMAFSNWVFLAGTWSSGEKEELKGETMEYLVNDGFLPFSFPLPSYPLRKKLWESCLKGYCIPGDVDLNGLASKFRFTGGQIKDAVLTALELARAKNPDEPVLSTDTLYEGCKARSNQKLAGFSIKINPHYTWEDIVLPHDVKEQLKEVCGFIKYRDTVYSDWGFEKKLSLGKGLNVLFSGPSGTGKTMAAEILAGEVKLDLYKIDLSGVVSKYIGETEKNLNRIFTEAETSNAILFFDEADALFGKRSEVRDSHDRYANIETAYLLQKMEEHTGTVILASNFRKNMDDAFLRRLHFTVEFPLPDQKSRELIWKNTFPGKTPLGEDVDFDFLSKFKFTGGNIKNIALAASFLAAEGSGPVTMENMIRATKRELQKIGKLFTDADFGEYSGFLK